MRNIFKHSAIFLLFLLCMIVTGSTLLFFIHVGISKFHLPMFIIVSAIIYYFISKKELSFYEYTKSIGISLIVIVVSIVIGVLTFDRSSDGNTYHKDAIGVFKEGLNPVYSDSKSFTIKRDGNDLFSKYYIWTDHYAKANWIIAANFYSFTYDIESGKAMNYISMYILFVIVFISLMKYMKWYKSLTIGLITVINPITATQLFTYYNDQLVLLYLFLAILMLFKIAKNFDDKESWFIYILNFILLANTKFNGMGYLMVFSFIFVLYYLFNAYKEKCLLPIFKKLCLIFIPLFIISLLFVGYPTYVKNTIEHHNPFFPLYDNKGEDIVTQQEPKSFIKMNNVSKLFYGTFSKANNLRENDKTDIKVPFMIYKSELKPSMTTDLRISGWGLWFSGIIIISTIIFIVYYKKYKAENYIFIALATTILLLIVMSESWWARYTPHFYLFVVISLYIMLKYNNKKVLNYIYIALISINTLIPLLGNCYYTVTNSIKIRNELYSLKNKKIVINDGNDYFGIFYNLKDYDILFEYGNVNGKKLYYNYIEYEEKK